MQFINYQYKIIRVDKEDRYGAIATVEDTVNINLQKKLRIIEFKKDTTEFIDYMKQHYNEYRTLNYPSLLEIFYFNKISNIDYKPVVSNKYYITYENCNGQGLFHHIRDKSFGEVLDLAVQLCATVKYLHLRGYLLCNINIDELLVIERQDGVQLKLASLPYVKGTSNSVMIDKDNNYFKAPEVLHELRYSRYSDIYLLGVLIFHMFSNSNIGFQNFRDALNEFNPQKNTELYEIKKIIYKCTALSALNRYTSVDQLIKDINNAFNKSYKVVDKKFIKLQPIHLINPSSREIHMKHLVNNVKQYLYENGRIKVAMLQGGIGTAKTSLVTNVSNRIEQEGINCMLLKLNKNIRTSFGTTATMLKEVMRYAEKDMIDKYASDIWYIMPEVMEMSNVAMPKGELNQENKIRLIYRLGNFLLEVASRYPFAVAITGFEWIDEDSYEVIKYVVNNSDKGKICFILGISLESEAQLNFTRQTNKAFKESRQVEILQIGNFNINETAEYIRLILGMDKAPLDFATNVYKETEGNPSYIYELIYLLYNENLIYVDDDGTWRFQQIDFKRLNVTMNINEVVINKINNLRDIEKEVLRILSIFSTAVSSDILEEMMELKMIELYNMLNDLENQNIVSKKVDDWGISYDFASLNVKKTIYEGIAHDQKLEYHKRASVILERKFANENRENRDELIYHMTKANKINEAIGLLMEAAEKMISSNLLNQAIQFLEQGFSMCKDSEQFSNKIRLCLNLGNLYEQIGEYQKAIYFYDIVESMAIRLNHKNILIDSYLNKISVMYKQKQIKSCIQYAVKAKKELNKTEYKEGLYELILQLSDLMADRRRYSLYIGILEKVLSGFENQEDRHEGYYARFLLAYSRHVLAIKKHNQAIPILLKAESIFERIGYFKYLTQTLNTLGVCYIDGESNITKAREYFEKTLSISQKINVMRYIEISYNNLAELLLMEDKYSEAMDNYNKALGIIKSTQNVNLNNLVHSNMAVAYTLMEEYKKASDFIAIAEDQFNLHKDTGNYLEFFYNAKSDYYYRLGYYELARGYAQKSVDMCISWGIPVNIESILLRRLAKIKLIENLDYQEDLKLCRDIFHANLCKLGRYACFQLSEIYAGEGMLDEARAFLGQGLSYEDKIETDILKVQYKYMDAMTCSGQEKQRRLMEAEAQMDSIENLEIKWKIYKAIGEGCLEANEYQEALKHYISALNVLRKLVHNVPDEYKTTFMLSHNRDTVREGLQQTSERIMQGRKRSGMLQKDIHKISLQNLDRYFDYSDYIDIYREGEQEDGKGKGASKLQNKINELISGFTEDNIENIKSIVNLCAEITQAKNAFLATLDEEDNLNVLASYNRYSEIPFHKYVIEQVRQKKDSIIVTDVFDYNKSKGDLLIPKEITAVYCIPIMSTKEEEGQGLLKERRRQKQINEKNIIGYLYLDTDSIINNFTTDSGNICKIVGKIAYILVDNYNLKIVSTVDKLTKLYTRKYFETALQNEMTYAEREGTEFSIIMIDIDKFKTVNDRFGHQKGDEILQGASSIIMGSLRKGDIAARYGGEEIIILLPGTGEEQGLGVAEKLRKKVENARLLGLHNPLTISLGVASYPNHSSWVKDLIEKADQAMYYSKENGRNQSSLYRADMSKTVRRIDKLAGIISGNLVEDQRKVETMLEILELQRSTELELEEKLFRFLGRSIEVSEAQMGILFEITETGEIRNRLARKRFIDTAVEEEYYNEEAVRKCIENQLGEYKVDWDSYPGVDTVTGMPDWQSIMAVPMTQGGRMVGVLYLSASIKVKEFGTGEYNFIKTLCDIFSVMK